MLTRITDRKIPCVYIHVYRITKNWGPGPYNSLRHADNRRYFSGLSLTRNRREAHMFYLAREVGKFGHVLAEKKVTLWWLMNSNMVKPENFGHLHLVYHFIISLSNSHTHVCVKHINKHLLVTSHDTYFNDFFLIFLWNYIVLLFPFLTIFILNFDFTISTLWYSLIIWKT